MDSIWRRWIRYGLDRKNIDAKSLPLFSLGKCALGFDGFDILTILHVERVVEGKSIKN
jgi:hypothetical protein